MMPKILEKYQCNTYNPAIWTKILVQIAGFYVPTSIIIKKLFDWIEIIVGECSLGIQL